MDKKENTYLIKKRIKGLNYNSIVRKELDYIIEYAEKNDLGLLIWILKYIKNPPRDKIIKYILDSRNISLIISLARDIDNIDINIITSYVLDTKDINIIYWYGVCVDKIDNNLFTDIIINSNNPKYIYLYALNKKNSNKNLLSEYIIKTNDLYYIEKYLNDIECNNKDKLERIVRFLKINNNYKNINELFENIINSGYIARTLNNNFDNKLLFKYYLFKYNKDLLDIYYSYLISDKIIADIELELLDYKYKKYLKNINKSKSKKIH